MAQPKSRKKADAASERPPRAFIIHVRSQLTSDLKFHCHHDWCVGSPIARANLDSKEVRNGYAPPPLAALCINRCIHHSPMLRRMSMHAGRRRRAWTILASLHRRSAAIARKPTPASRRQICHTDFILAKRIHTLHFSNIRRHC